MSNNTSEQLQPFDLQTRLSEILTATQNELRVALEQAQGAAPNAPLDVLLSALLGLRTPIHPHAVYSYRDAARVTGISERTLQRWTLRRGEKRLHVRAKGGVKYFLGQDLLNWLNQ